MTDTVPRALIAIATYRRPRELALLLESLEQQVSACGADVVVVDNDAEGSGREVALASSVVKTYVVEAEPGIAQARNRGLDFFDENYDAIVFVDDDEVADAAWLETLLGYLRDSGSDIVLGAVITTIPETAPKWVSAGGYLQRGIMPTGSSVPTAATNNVAIRRARWVEAGSQRFDPAFSATGGSDTAFFLRLTEAGLTITSVAEAIVYEPMPTDRVTRRWVVRRMTRNGIVAGRLHAERRGRRAVVEYGLGQIRAGIRLVLGDLRHRRPVTATSSRTLLMGVGEVYSAFGGRIYEYRRPRRR